MLSGITKKAYKTLADAGVDNAQMEALWLFRGANEDPATFQTFISARKTGKPLAYILGTQDFMGREFYVDESVLIPRPETETLTREAISRLKSMEGEPRVLDLGTGSGIIAVTIALECRIKMSALDKSPAAIRTARRNAARHKIEKPISFMESDGFDSLSEKFDMIVSNPPYVKTAEISLLQKEIQFEPRLALDGGEDGFSLIEKIIRDSSRFLNENGQLLMEVGMGQPPRALELMRKAGFKNLSAFKDDAGIERVVAGETA